MNNDCLRKRGVIFACDDQEGRKAVVFCKMKSMQSRKHQCVVIRSVPWPYILCFMLSNDIKMTIGFARAF